jgi:hypothetical protein
MTAKTRASKGGETGMNGEFYNGGTFLPNTTLPKGTARPVVTATRKMEVAPYTWEMQPTATARTIWSLVGVTLNYNRNTRQIEVTNNAQAIAYYGDKVNGYSLSELAEMWNNGTRWIEAK